MELAPQHDPNIRELIRITFAKYSNKDKKSITPFHILKTLSLAREMLSDDNPLKAKLTFYWYTHGPHSQAFVDNFQHMRDRMLIVEGAGGYTFSPTRINEPLVTHDESIKEALYAITSVIKDNHRIRKTNDYVYRDAPYPWYKDYAEFQSHLRDYCDYLGGKEDAPHDSKDIIESLRQATTTVPDEAEFQKLASIHDTFSKMLMPLLEAGKPHEHKAAYEKLFSLSKDIWGAFGSIVRVLHHDPDYEEFVSKWKEEYQDKLSKLEDDIKNAKDTLEIPESAKP